MLIIILSEVIMAVPDFQSFFYPTLLMSKDGKEYSLNDLRDYLTDYFSLTEEDRSERVPSGAQTKFDNRIYWTKSYFSKAKLIENTKRSHFKITEKGILFLDKFKDKITIKNLENIPEFYEFKYGIIDGAHEINESTIYVSDNSKSNDKTPFENLEDIYQILQEELAHELLQKIRDNSWQFFEDLVVDLMVKMGYGGSKNKAGNSIKRVGDEGIDGTINEDKLGLDLIYLQAKKWKEETTIGRPEIKKFVGALHGRRAKKGVFITTSHFSDNAYEYVKNIDPKVILIDGKTLTKLMIEYNVGTTIVEIYQVKKIDFDYFEK
ncbi:restriction endonuclease [Capnocytophaga cynodegmi]|uniref:restriction endonuclease n=1 Tax=Capnocytophaga cynodegmi TaxID=28189 RepID=UPI00385D2D79